MQSCVPWPCKTLKEMTHVRVVPSIWAESSRWATSGAGRCFSTSGESKGGGDSLPWGALLSFGFIDTFPTLSLSFLEAVLKKTQLPPVHIEFVLAALLAPYHFCGKGVVIEGLFTPRAGIGHGDPLSPLLFSLCASFPLVIFDDLKLHIFLCMWMIFVCSAQESSRVRCTPYSLTCTHLALFLD